MSLLVFKIHAYGLAVEIESSYELAHGIEVLGIEAVTICYLLTDSLHSINTFFSVAHCKRI